MSTFLDERFVEKVTRLALGIEPVDAGRRSRVSHSVRVVLEGVAESPLRTRRPGQTVNDWLPRLERHDSCRYVLRYSPDLKSPIDIRLIDGQRRFVPRRFRVTIPTLAQVEAGLPLVPLTDRVRRPVLFPGAAYDTASGCSGLRGRAIRSGKPMRWARVEARLAGGEVVGRAHGDDRGEFLLLLGLDPAHVDPISDPMAVTVVVSGPDVDPIPSTPGLDRRDPLWDLPLEAMGLPGSPDLISPGTTLPAGYRNAAVTPEVDLPLGRVSSAAVAPFEFT